MSPVSSTEIDTKPVIRVDCMIPSAVSSSKDGKVKYWTNVNLHWNVRKSHWRQIFKIVYLPQGNDYTHTEYNHASNGVWSNVWFITAYRGRFCNTRPSSSKSNDDKGWQWLIKEWSKAGTTRFPVKRHHTFNYNSGQNSYSDAPSDQVFPDRFKWCLKLVFSKLSRAGISPPIVGNSVPAEEAWRVFFNNISMGQSILITAYFG